MGRVWAYSLLALAPFFPVGCMQLHRALKKAGSLRWRKGLTAAICAAGLAWTYFATPNAFLRGQKLETLAQGRLAAYVEEGASLLQYNHLDDGLYLTTDTVPQEKYFVRLNVHLDEMLQRAGSCRARGRSGLRAGSAGTNCRRNSTAIS